MVNLRLNRTTVVLRQTIIFCDEWYWVLLALAALLLLIPSPSQSHALLVVSGLWIFAWLAGREPMPSISLNGTLRLMFCMVLASLWTTFDISYSMQKISGMVFGVGGFFAVAREADRPHGRNLIRFSGDRKFNAVQYSINYSPLHRFIHLRGRMARAHFFST